MPPPAAAPPNPPPVVQAAPPIAPTPAPPVAPAPPPPFVYDQKPLSSRTYLVTPEQAQGIINRFRDSYKKMGNPRILLFVNRSLVDESSGVKLSARSEETETVRSKQQGVVPAATNAPAPSAASSTQTQKVTGKNTYRVQERPEASLADRQTMRDIERLFGRPLRMAGASLVDQRTATQMMAGKSVEELIGSPEGAAARKDREAVSKIADIVLEILVSSRNVTAREISGDKVYSVPDLQVTAVRLSDAKIVGQATAADLLGGDPGRMARSFDVREITEATALSLMEDMMLQ